MPLSDSSVKAYCHRKSHKFVCNLGAIWLVSGIFLLEWFTIKSRICSSKWRDWPNRLNPNFFLLSFHILREMCAGEQTPAGKPHKLELFTAQQEKEDLTEIYVGVLIWNLFVRSSFLPSILWIFWAQTAAVELGVIEIHLNCFRLVRKYSQQVRSWHSSIGS